jgi:chromosome segregation ATPase
VWDLYGHIDIVMSNSIWNPKFSVGNTIKSYINGDFKAWLLNGVPKYEHNEAGLRSLLMETIRTVHYALTDIEYIREHLESVSNELKQFKSSINKSLTDKQPGTLTTSHYIDEISRLNKQLTAAHDKITSLEESLDVALGDNTVLEAELFNSQEENTELKAQLSASEKENIELKAQLSASEKENINLRGFSNRMAELFSNLTD